ncbi:MAG: hypothetical protein ACE5HV_00045 [Acidobacteriota bacterium]
MKIKTIRFAHGATINTGNYSSRKFDLEASVELDEGDDHNSEFEGLRDWVLKTLAVTMRNQLGRDPK